MAADARGLIDYEAVLQGAPSGRGLTETLPHGWRDSWQETLPARTGSFLQFALSVMSYPSPDLTDPSTWPFADYDHWMENYRESEVDDEDPLPTVEEAVAMATQVAREAKRVLGDRLGRVWLHGSRARGDHLPESDLDLLMEKGREGLNTRILEQALSPCQDKLWEDRFLDVQFWFIEPGRWERLDDFQLKRVRPYAIGVLP